MKVIVCGAGQVGWQIARHLSSEKNFVTVVDQDPALVRRITDVLDVGGVIGFASHPDILERAGAEDADLIIAATHSDEVNMVTCQVAHSVYSIPRKIARLRAQSYLDAIYRDLYRQDHLPIDVVISPEREVAEAALRRLKAPSAFDTEMFQDGKLQLLGIALDENCPVVNTPLRQLSELFSTLQAIVAGIRRDGKLFVPAPEDQVFPGDQIYVFVATEETNRTLEIFGKSTVRRERVIIVGGGNVGLRVAQELEKGPERIRCKLIERNRKQAERAADALERTIVLHGDGLDQELLEEANVSKTDALLAVTDDDKVNMLSSARAKSLGVPLTIALVNEPSLVSLLGPLGIDAYIGPRATTVSSILRHIRHGRITAVYSIGDAEAEVFEAQVLDTSSIAGQKIRDIDWPEGALVTSIAKKGKLQMPRGDTLIEKNDVVTVFAMAEDVAQVEQLFQVGLNFF
ncbi:Trk system potassium transporter TrkA [Oceanomicrobium pacificus]|uniref:Trk system potassium uptake protein TrkA n=1 Tax=Oceanomicrobium pacificus TaxID=2692916 RepID=A0A6B0U488_9RHOB|nr:Trk system potassium transporter TrkA [Oceanomicrobium pacificus]MXU65761.1 Trk system potassium transporter TrkA [Oceanomicrobium pacificus]